MIESWLAISVPGQTGYLALLWRCLDLFAFVVQTEEGLRWKRHADQLKHCFPPNANPESSSAEDAQMSAFPPDDPSGPAEAESPEPNIEEPETSEPSSPKMVEPQYPQRNSQPPNRYVLVTEKILN